MARWLTWVAGRLDTGAAAAGEAVVEPFQHLAYEVRRAARYHRQLSLLLVHTETSGRDPGTRADRAHACLRQADQVYPVAAGLLMVLLPETGSAGALTAGERLRHELQHVGREAVRIGVATFPDEAESGGGLWEAAEIALRSSLAQRGGCVRRYGRLCKTGGSVRPEGLIPRPPDFLGKALRTPWAV